MAYTYTSLNYHLVASTKNREPWFLESICEWLWPYLGAIAGENGMKALEISGVASDKLFRAFEVLNLAGAVKVIDIFGNDTITVMTVR
jgi:hypothetical protein